MEERADTRVAFSPMQLLAGFSALSLIAIVLWQVGQMFLGGDTVSATNGSWLRGDATTPYESIDWQVPATDDAGEILTAIGAPDEDGLSNIAGNVVGTLLNSYNTLTENGAYSPEAGEEIAGAVASTLRAEISYETFTASDIQTDADTSYDRMLAYRNDLRIALEPLLKNQGYELSIFANYIDTADTKHLEALEDIAGNYRAAITSAASVIVPEDAAEHHVDILNALSRFASTIERMSQHADDAFASVALLRTYNENETTLFTSFNTLAGYYKSKLP